MIAGYSIGTVAFICAGVFLSGLVDAIGGGGGLISVPVYLLAGLPTHFALGTNKLSSGLGTMASALRYIKNGYVKWNLTLPAAVLAMLGANLGTRLQLSVSEAALRYALIGVLIVVAGVMFKRKPLPEEPGEIAPRRQLLLVCGSALACGVYDGFYGPGTGTFLLLAFCRLGRLDVRSASGSVKFVNVSSNVGALTASILAGKAIFAIGLPAAAFAFAGHYLGAGLMMKNGTKIVMPVIFTVLGLLFVKVALELFGIGY